MEKQKVAWIGAGVMGASQAGHLVKAGWEVKAYGRHYEKVAAKAPEFGFIPCRTIAEAVADADFVFVMVGFVLFAILDRAGVFLREVSLEVPATVYSGEGVPVGETTVAIDGPVSILGDRSFVGRFAVGEVEATCREGVEARIRWDTMWEGAQDILFYRAGEFLSLGVERMLYITENLQSFGLRLEDGTIIATDEYYVPLLMSGYYYSILPVFSNQF